MKTKNLILGFIALIIIFGGAGSSQAARIEMQNGVNVRGDFDLGPTSFSIEGNPGDTFTREVQVTNRKGRDQKYTVAAEDFQGSPDDPEQTVLLQGEDSGKYSSKDWVSTEMDSFTLKHGERQYFNVTIKIPQNADPGDHYASVLVSGLPDVTDSDIQDKSAPNVRITSRVGTLFFIKVKGPTKQDATLESFIADKFKYEKLPVNFKMIFRNNGTVRLRPEGTIEIKNSFGVVTDTIEVKAFNVLRESVRAMSFEWKKDGFFLGRYTATLKLKRGYDNIIDESAVSFWVLPWKALLIIFIAFVLLIAILIYLKKKISAKSKEAAKARARRRK